MIKILKTLVMQGFTQGGGHSNPLIKHFCTKCATCAGTPTRRAKRGFTLAEVLITLAIVGIIAAMTIPNLISKNQKRETVTRMKDSYSTMANALKMAEEEYGNGFSFTDGSSSWSRAKSAQAFETYLQPFLKVNFKYKDAQCDELTKSYPQGGGTPYTDDCGACYSLMNGSAIIFWAGRLPADDAGLSDAVTMAVVTNPNKKKKIIGKDVFNFAIVPNENGWYMGTLINFREPNATRERLKILCGTNAGRISLGAQTSSSGVACTELIKRDGWAIMDDYPIKF